MSGPFGWSLPPGCSPANLDEAMGCETAAEEDARAEREAAEDAEADLLTDAEKASLRNATDAELVALADLAVITEKCLKIGNPPREQAITAIVRDELGRRGIVAARED